MKYRLPIGRSILAVIVASLAASITRAAQDAPPVPSAELPQALGDAPGLPSSSRVPAATVAAAFGPERYPRPVWPSAAPPAAVIQPSPQTLGADDPATATWRGLNDAHEVFNRINDQYGYLGSTAWKPRTYLTTEALILNRTLVNGNFPATSLGVAGPIIGQLKDLRFRYQTGMRVTLGHEVDEWTAIEGTYFGGQSYNDSFVLKDPQGRLFGVLNGFGTHQQPGFPSPPFPPTFGVGNHTTEQSGEYHSRFYSFELNIVRSLFDVSGGAENDHFNRLSVGVIGGFRYFSLPEQFALRTQGDKFPQANINDPMARADYTIKTNNQMFGGQIGLRSRLAFSDRLSIVDDIKVAGLANNADQTSNARFIFTQPVPIDITVPRVHQASVFASVLFQNSFKAQYAITKKLVMTGGYEFFALSGRALAPLQVDANVAKNGHFTPILIDKGATVFQGASIGFTYTF